MKIVRIKLLAPTVEGYPLEKWVYTQPLLVLEETEQFVLVKYKGKMPIHAWFDKQYVDSWL